MALASTSSTTSTSVAMIEQDNLVGLYVCHNQQLDLSVANGGTGVANGTFLQQQLPAVSSSPTRKISKTSATSNGSSSPLKSNSSSNGHHHPQQPHFRRFELNAKLFAINEPYLMKTERDSLMQQLLSDKAAEKEPAAEVDQKPVPKKAQNGLKVVTPTPATVASKTVVNRTKKRKKALTKKIAYLDQNLASDEERRLAMTLIEQCLLKQQVTPSAPSTTSTTTTKTGRQKTASPSKRKQSIVSASTNNNSTTTSSTSSNNTTTNNNDTSTPTPGITTPTTTAEQLLRACLQSGDNNQEAQTFVGGLFRNRFESLNYRGKVFCNPYGRVIKAKIGLSSYLIPAKCSFAGADICEGLQALKGELTSRTVALAQSSSSSLPPNEPFYALLDPAWDNNKSVKRKKSYETVSFDYLKRMCRDLKELLDVVLLQKQQTQNGTSEANDHPNQAEEERRRTPPPVVVAIWTTKADKDFVIDEMLPLLQAKMVYDLKWHKVTTTGCPVKVHGGLEFLIVAERWWEQVGSTNGHTANSKQPPRTGLLVSVPSAVHSHKPTPVPVLRKLYGLDKMSISRSNSISSSSSRSPEYSEGESPVELQFNYRLAESEVISPLMGVELFARYLQSGFHSIGYECIKLQNEELFTSRLVQ